MCTVRLTFADADPAVLLSRARALPAYLLLYFSQQVLILGKDWATVGAPPCPTAALGGPLHQQLWVRTGHMD